jgi:hypothetical protein
MSSVWSFSGLGEVVWWVVIAFGVFLLMQLRRWR